MFFVLLVNSKGKNTVWLISFEDFTDELLVILPIWSSSDNLGVDSK